MSQLGHSRPGRASRKSGHVRDAPKPEIASEHERLRNGLRSLRATASQSLRARAAQPPARARLARLREKSDLSRRINVIWGVQSPRKKYFCFSEVQIGLHDLPSRPERGALAIVTNVGRGAVDAAVPARKIESQGGFYRSVSGPTVRRRTALKRTAKACGPDASWLASSLCGGFASPTGRTKPSSAGRR